MASTGSADHFPETPKTVWDLACRESVEAAALRIECAPSKSSPCYRLVLSPLDELFRLADSTQFATEVLELGATTAEHCHDTLQDLYHRITSGQTPIVQEKSLREDLLERARGYEYTKRRNRFVALGEWEPEWQERLGFPKTAIGASKLKVLKKLADRCTNFERAKGFIDAEIAKRPLAVPQSTEAQQLEAAITVPPVVSRSEIESAVQAFEQEAAEQQRIAKKQQRIAEEQERIEREASEEQHRIDRETRQEQKRAAKEERERAAKGERERAAKGERERAAKEKSTQSKWAYSPESSDDDESEEGQDVRQPEDASSSAMIQDASSSAMIQDVLDDAEAAGQTRKKGDLRVKFTVPKKGKEPAPPIQWKSLWERDEADGPPGSPFPKRIVADVLSACDTAADQWAQEMKIAVDDYVAHPFDGNCRARLDNVSRRNPAGLKEAYAILGEEDWAVHTLPFTLKELSRANESGVMRFCDVKERDKPGRLSAMNELMDTIETITGNTIIQSADGKEVAVYFQAGMDPAGAASAHEVVTTFLQEWAEAHEYLPNPRNLPKRKEATMGGEVLLSFGEGISDDFLSDPHGFQAATVFLRDIEPLTSRVADLVRIWWPTVYCEQRRQQDRLASTSPDYRTLLGASRGIHTGFRFLKDVQQPPTMGPLDGNVDVNMTVLTAFQSGSGTGGDFLVGTKYYQHRFSAARGSLLFFRGDLLYHAVTRYEANPEDDRQHEHITLILEPCANELFQPPAGGTVAEDRAAAEQDLDLEWGKALAYDLMDCSF